MFPVVNVNPDGNDTLVFNAYGNDALSTKPLAFVGSRWGINSPLTVTIGEEEAAEGAPAGANEDAEDEEEANEARG